MSKERTANSGPVIVMEHIKKSFGSQEVLKDMCLEVQKGENLVVLGRSGTGKSVLIKCLVRLMEPDSGTIRLLDRDMMELNGKSLNDMRKKIGFLFQGAALYDSMTVGENLAFPLREVKGLKKRDVKEKVQEALANVGLEDAVEKMPAELSGGMRKRVGLARSLIMKPEIMLYDEPTAGLDTITSREINRLILDMQQKYATSSILITHDIECARMTANRMIVIRDGKCEMEGTFAELEHSDNKWVRSFFE